MKKHEKNPNLWFTMAFVLSYDLARYREQALAAANNAMFFHKQHPELLTAEAYQALRRLLDNLSARN